MFEQISERLARLKFSWETIVNSGQVCLLLMFQVLFWTFVVNSALTRTLAGANLILYGVLWVLHGIYPLLIENRRTSVAISSGVIVVSGCSIIGLGIATILSLMVEVDWVLRMAGIFYNLAFFAWIFVILKVAPTITRELVIGVVFCFVATGYAFVCNVLVVMRTLVTDLPHITADWEQAIGYIVSGGAMIGWTLCVMRKTASANFRWLVPAFIIAGIIFIGFGIVTATVLISR